MKDYDDMTDEEKLAFDAESERQFDGIVVWAWIIALILILVVIPIAIIFALDCLIFQPFK